MKYFGFIVFLIINQLVIFLAHYLIYRFGTTYYPVLDKNKFTFGITLFVLSISFTLSMFLVRAWQNNLTAFFYKISAVWLGALLWVFLGIVICSLIAFLIKDTNTVKQIGLIFFLSIFVINTYGLINAFNTKVIEKEVRINNLPAEWVGKKGLFVSDTHYGNIHTQKRAFKLANKIKKINPDILFIAGDFYDGPVKDFESFSKPFSDINPSLGKYFVTGNHEDYAGLAKSLSALKNAGFVITDDEQTIKNGVQIIGIPYLENSENENERQNTQLTLTKNNYDINKPSIVIKHVPTALNVLAENKVDFVFSGHTHGGQMWPFTYIVKKIYGPFWYGFNQNDETLFYTTSGVGSWGPPQKIGTKSEILLVKFNTK